MRNDHLEQRGQTNELTVPKTGTSGSVGTVLPPYAGRAAMALPWPPLDLHRLKADLAVVGGDFSKGLGFTKIGRRCREMREAGLVMGPDQLGTEFSLKRVARILSVHLSVTEAL
jgi:hypothetical protein